VDSRCCRSGGLAGAVEAAELFFVAAHPLGEGLDRCAQMADLGDEPREAPGVVAAVTVVFDDGGLR